MATKKIIVPGTGPLFPVKKYEPKTGLMPDTRLLKRDILRMSAELGPDHPKVKMLKKDLERRGSK